MNDETLQIKMFGSLWKSVDGELPRIKFEYSGLTDHVICKNDILDYSFVGYMRKGAWYQQRTNTKIKVTHWQYFPEVTA